MGIRLENWRPYCVTDVNSGYLSLCGWQHLSSNTTLRHKKPSAIMQQS